MNLRTITNKLFTSFSDARMIAEANADFYKSIYDRGNERIAFITNYDASNSSFDNDYIVINNGGEETLAKLTDLAIKYKESVTDYINNEANDGLDDIVIVYTNYFKSEEAQITIEELCDQLGKNQTSNFISWKAFEAITLDPDKAGEIFSTVINTQLPNTDISVTQSITNIYSILMNESAKLSDKIRSVSNFIGKTLLLEKQELFNPGQVDLTIYTGANPVASWFNGLDFSNVGAALASIGDIYLRVAKFMIVDISVALWKGISSIFSSLFGYAKQTFSDPVDYAIEGKQIGFFNIPCKTVSPLETTGIPTIFNNGEDGIDTISFQIGGVYHKLYPQEDTNTGKWYLFDERYVKPIDFRKVINIFNRFDFIVDNISGKGYKNITYRRLLSLFDALSAEDLSMDGSSSERDVYAGIVCSYQLEAMLVSSLRAYVWTRYTDAELDEEVDLDQRLVGNNFVSSTLDEKLYEFISSCNSCSTGEYIFSSSGDDLHGLGPVPETITNADFIKVLTSTRVYDSYAGSSLGQPSSSMTATAYNTLDFGLLDNVATYLNVVKDITDPDWGTVKTDQFGRCMLHLLATLKYSSSRSNRGVLIAYRRNSGLTSKQVNARVKTDTENADAINKFLIGVLAVGTAIAVGVGANKLYLHAIQSRDAAYFNYSRQSLKFERLLRLGKYGQTGADTVWREMNRNRRKYKILSSIFGPTLAPGSALTAAIPLVNNGSINSVIKLIRD